MIDMSLFETITRENVFELEPGEWIWDNSIITRHAHERYLDERYIHEPVGFRQIDILNLDLFPTWSSKPFMLSTIDRYGEREWVYFEEGRFYRFKRKE